MREQKNPVIHKVLPHPLIIYFSVRVSESALVLIHHVRQICDSRYIIFALDTWEIQLQSVVNLLVRVSTM